MIDIRGLIKTEITGFKKYTIISPKNKKCAGILRLRKYVTKNIKAVL